MNIYQKNNEEYFLTLKTIVISNPKLFGRIIHSKENQHLLDWVNNQVPLLSDAKYSLGTKLNWIFSGRVNFPICTVCNSSANYQFRNIGVHDIYSNFCCRKCFNQSKYHKDKVKQTCLQKYGTQSYFQTSEFRTKFEQTCLKKYNSTNPFSSETIKQKIKDHVQKKYGCDNTAQIESAKEKKKQTCLKKYGVEHYTQTCDYKTKCQTTSLVNYGSQHYMKYQAFQSMLKNEYDQPEFSLASLNNIRLDQTELLFKCNKCKKTFFAIHHDGQHSMCPRCYPKYRSIGEIQLHEYLTHICKFEMSINNRILISPYELDIYIPEKKLAVEYDGLYWHSDIEGHNPTKQLKKTEACEKQGIQLIHIFENEWLTKQDIVKSRLKNLLGIYDKTVYARKCVIKDVDSKTSKEFQEQNHIQGAVNASVNLGLFFDDELVSVMTFGKTRFSKKYEWELLRFCNKCGYRIPGAAGKLLKHFERNWKPKSLVSYADRRWSQGKVYKALKFDLDHISAPNYWYFKTRFLLESRIKFQKHKLASLFRNFDNNKSEVENMKLNNYNRIFDCGNLIFVKIY